MPAEHILMEAVESSCLAAYGYDAGHHWLDVQFPSGAIWRYQDVPLEIALAFGAAASKGTYYTAHVRGHYPGTLMTGPCPACGDRGWIGETCTDCGTQPYERATPALPVTQG